MKTFKTWTVLCLGVLWLGGANAGERLQVFACEPEWGALVSELGGERVEVYTATTAMQDPHQIQARPSLIAQARRADLLVCNGGGLEDGWLPVLLRSAANARVQPGQPGHFLATTALELKERPASLDRALGDIHAEGNPHIVTDPNNLLPVAAALTPVLAALDPAGGEGYQRRHGEFSRRWQQAILGWESQAAPLRGMRLAVQHRSWVYLFDWLGLQEAVVLEPIAGVPPSTPYLAQAVAELKARPVRGVVVAAYQDPRAAQWVAQRLGVKVVTLPFTVGEEAGAPDLYALYGTTLQRLLEVGP